MSPQRYLTRHGDTIDWLAWKYYGRTDAAIHIMANDTDITALIAERMVGVRLADASGSHADTLEIVLADPLANAPLRLPPMGAELQLSLSYDGQLRQMGVFVCSGDRVVRLAWHDDAACPCCSLGRHSPRQQRSSNSKNTLLAGGHHTRNHAVHHGRRTWDGVSDFSLTIWRDVTAH
ncbi:tail protein X [Xylella taiwanensis]|uniref:Uncharacterized protein n=1 Tax=Xylella taiwanensis TaxID=1444770 RepID=Z9JK34_9GAMM|nr:tail protein X [Xylella taiwanensis]EWS78780.1 hypothetical protein AF72_04205 [Xylella taiwanensis]